MEVLVETGTDYPAETPDVDYFRGVDEKPAIS